MNDIFQQIFIGTQLSGYLPSWSLFDVDTSKATHIEKATKCNSDMRPIAKLWVMWDGELELSGPDINPAPGKLWIRRNSPTGRGQGESLSVFAQGIISSENPKPVPHVKMRFNFIIPPKWEPSLQTRPRKLILGHWCPLAEINTKLLRQTVRPL